MSHNSLGYNFFFINKIGDYANTFGNNVPEDFFMENGNP